ncbi:hypothetical protein [Kineothrix sedimenti]|uniref:Uncharacterized protein n=1 Tax=Kineothrix sedimenti TaxID=3123317 RepID=A0ABZ3EWR8_9FIRM
MKNRKKGTASAASTVMLALQLKEGKNDILFLDFFLNNKRMLFRIADENLARRIA